MTQVEIVAAVRADRQAADDEVSNLEAQLKDAVNRCARLMEAELALVEAYGLVGWEEP